MVGFHVMLKIYVSFKQNFIRSVTPDNLAKTVYTIFVFLFLALDSILQFSPFEYLPGVEHIFCGYVSYIWSNKPAEILP